MSSCGNFSASGEDLLLPQITYYGSKCREGNLDVVFD